MIFNVNFNSDEWGYLKSKIEENIARELVRLETAETERAMFQAQGALKTLRNLLNLDKRNAPPKA
jgi:hypothetical protein